MCLPCAMIETSSLYKIQSFSNFLELRVEAVFIKMEIVLITQTVNDSFGIENFFVKLAFVVEDINGNFSSKIIRNFIIVI